MSDDFEEIDDEQGEDARYERELALGKRHHQSLKWIAEGCSTISEIVAVLRDHADFLLKKERDGFVLVDDVDNGHYEIVCAELAEAAEKS